MDLRAVLKDLTEAFASQDIAYALIGGLALAPHGAPRATTDVDFLVEADRSAEVDRIMTGLGYRALQLTQDVGNYELEDGSCQRVNLVFAHCLTSQALFRRAQAWRIVAPGDLSRLLEEGQSPGRQRALREAGARSRDREHEQLRTLDALLDWIEQLHALFGEPPLDERPWRGGDFRL